MRGGKIERIEFVPFGPFALPRLSQKKLDATARARFWRGIDARHPGLSKAVGCYVFAITASKGTLPWYIGRTTTASFARETWAPRRLVQYQGILRRRRQGTPVLLLVAKRSPAGGFAKPSRSGQAAIDLLRDLVLESALLRNRRLQNRRDTRHLQGITMSGFINAKPGRPSDAARHLAQVLRKD
jgi:hypothetical protein